MIAKVSTRRSRIAFPRSARWGSHRRSPPYWIDKALTGVEIGGGKPFLVGNATRLARDGEEIVAQSSYELFEDERMSVRGFIEGLQLWRAAVVAAIQTNSAISLPPGATYWAQRNPYP